MRSQDPSEFARFAAVAAVGLVVDISAAWLFWMLLGTSITLSAGVGFFAGALVNYLLHEFWTFKRAESRTSARRMTRYGFALGVTLAVRLAAVWLLSRLFDAETYALHIFVLAVGLSFASNYAISKSYVFKPSAGKEADEERESQ